MDVDVAIIGAGSAGIAAYVAARRHTDRIRLIEAGPGGTTCASVGCMPSKLLIAAAHAAHQVRHAAQFGIAAEPRIDGAAVLRRVRSERDRFVRLVREQVAQYPAAHRLQGRAQFVDDHTLQLDSGERLSAARIVIATGSRAELPPAWRALGARAITSDGVFEWTRLPASVAVVGSGPIGLELGQALHRLGVRVRLFDRGGLINPLSDEAVVDATRRALSGELAWSSAVELGAPVAGNEGIALHWQEAGKARSETFEFLLAATGRKPDLQSLQLERTTLLLDRHGVPVFDRQTGQCTPDHLFIAGDADAALPLLHEATDDGRIAGSNAARYPQVERMPRRAGLQIVFSDPQLAVAGDSRASLVAAGRDFREAELSFEDQGRSRVMARNLGLLKVYAESGSGEFLGAEMIAPEAEHLAHLLAWCRQQRLTVQQMLALPFYHPTVEEGLRSALRELQRVLDADPEVPDCLSCGPAT